MNVLKSSLLFLTLLFIASGVQAEEGHHSFGVQAGEVLLQSDVGGIYGNGLGGGLFFDYAASDYLEFELSWLTSHHTGTDSNIVPSSPMSLTQNSYAIALQYNIDTYDIFTPYFKGGAEFVNHGQDVINPSNNQTVSSSTTGFGLDIGIGSKVDLAQNLMAGLDIMYHSIFNSTTTPPGSAFAVNTIEPYVTFMLRVGFAFGSEKHYQTGGAKPPGHD